MATSTANSELFTELGKPKKCASGPGRHRAWPMQSTGAEGGCWSWQSG